MGGRRRPLDPEARAVTVRAIAGLAALNLGLAVVGTSFLWAARGLPRWTDVLRLSGLGYLLGVAVFGVIWTQLLVVGVPFGGWAVLATLVAATGVCGAVGSVGAAAFLAALSAPRPGHPSRCSSPPLASHSSGSCSRRSSAPRGCRAFRRSTPGRSGCRRAKAIYFFEGSTSRSSRRAPDPTYPPLRPILDAAAFHAMGRRRRRHVPPAVLVPRWRAASRRSPGCLYRHVPPWATVAAAPARPRRPALRRAAPGAAGRRAGRPALRGRRAAARTLATRRAGVAPRGIAVLLAGAALTKREGMLFAALALGVTFVCSWPRRRSAWPRLALVAGIVVAAAIPWRLWYRAHDITAGGATVPRRERIAPSRARLAPALVRRPLRHEPLVRGAVRRCCSRSPRRSSGATGGSPGFVAALLVLVFLGGAWVTYSYPGLADHARTRRSTRSCATRARSCSSRGVDAASRSARSGEDRRRSRRDGGNGTAHRGGDHRRSRSSAYPAVVAADGGDFPSAVDCVRKANPGETAPLDLVFGRRDTPPARRTSCWAGCGPSDTSTRRCGRTGADGGRSCTTGSPRTRRARALSPRPVVRASRHGSRSNRRSRLARAVP